MCSSSPPDTRDDEVSGIPDIDRTKGHRIHILSQCSFSVFPGAYAAHSYPQDHSKRKSSGMRGGEDLHMTGNCLSDAPCSPGCMMVPN